MTDSDARKIAKVVVLAVWARLFGKQGDLLAQAERDWAHSMTAIDAAADAAIKHLPQTVKPVRIPNPDDEPVPAAPGYPTARAFVDAFKALDGMPTQEGA